MNKTSAATLLFVYFSCLTSSWANRNEKGARKKALPTAATRTQKTNTRVGEPPLRTFAGAHRKALTPFHNFLSRLINPLTAEKKIKSSHDSFAAKDLTLEGKPLSAWSIRHAEGQFVLATKNKTIELATQVPSEVGPSYLKAVYNVVFLKKKDGSTLTLSGKLFLAKVGATYKLGSELPLTDAYPALRQILNDSLIQNGDISIEFHGLRAPKVLFDDSIANVKDFKVKEGALRLVMANQISNLSPPGYLMSDDVAIKLSSDLGIAEIPLSKLSRQ